LSQNLSTSQGGQDNLGFGNDDEFLNISEKIANAFNAFIVALVNSLNEREKAYVKRLLEEEKVSW
jgi:hypothetical protein